MTYIASADAMRIHRVLRPGSVAVKYLPQFLSDFLYQECGQDIIEYALVAALVALVAIAGIAKVGNAASNVFTSVGSKLSSAI